LIAITLTSEEARAVIAVLGYGEEEPDEDDYVMASDVTDRIEKALTEAGE